MNFIMIPCYRATELIEKEHVVGLTAIERVKLKIHTAMCEACSRYEKQSKVLDEILGGVLMNKDNMEPISDETVRRVADKILSQKK
jgi:hypothetical protein